MADPIKKSRLEVGYYLVAFIDILNQKEELQNLKELPITQTEMQDFIKTLKRTFGSVNLFRETFENFYQSFSEPSAFAKLLPPEQQRVLNEMRKSEVKFQRFADTVIIYASLRTDRIEVPINGVFSALAASAVAFLMMLATERVCRGGIDIGLAAEMQEGEIYGRALYEAYRLEREVAQYPRIVIGDGVMNYLTSIKNASGPDIISQITKKQADNCLDLIVKDVDGYPILDYLGKGFKKHFAGNHLKDILPKAHTFIIKEAERWNEIRNSKLSFRYDLLRRYFEARLPLWKDSLGH